MEFRSEQDSSMPRSAWFYSNKKIHETFISETDLILLSDSSFHDGQKKATMMFYIEKPIKMLGDNEKEN